MWMLHTCPCLKGLCTKISAQVVHVCMSRLSSAKCLIIVFYRRIVSGLCRVRSIPLSANSGMYRDRLYVDGMYVQECHMLAGEGKGGPFLLYEVCVVERMSRHALCSCLDFLNGQCL